VKQISHEMFNPAGRQIGRSAVTIWTSTSPLISAVRVISLKKHFREAPSKQRDALNLWARRRAHDQGEARSPELIILDAVIH
jgi:hypothetical protein